jgi:mono/diheme cytochrome c family protein
MKLSALIPARQWLTFSFFGLFIVGWAFLIPIIGFAQDGQALYQEKCAACHSIGGGDILGPDLKGVVAKRDRPWLERWLKEPDKVVAENDPLATELLKQYNNMPMPNMGLTDADVKAIIAYLETAGGAATPLGPPIEIVPLGNNSDGNALFTGAAPLENGGTSCIACHTVAGVGALGGGNLGPDLTRVYQKLGDAGMAQALSTLPFPTMKPLYVNKPLTKEEQSDLRAFFAWANQQNVPSVAPDTAWIWSISGLGVVVLFGVMFLFRPRQHDSIAEMLRRKS